MKRALRILEVVAGMREGDRVLRCDFFVCGGIASFAVRIDSESGLEDMADQLEELARRIRTAAE